MTTKAQLIFSSTYWKIPPALIKYLMIDSFLFKPLKISCYFNVINWVAFEISIRKLYCKSIRLYLFTKDGIRAWLVDTWDQSVGADVKAKGTMKVSWAQESWLVYHWVPSIYCLSEDTTNHDDDSHVLSQILWYVLHRQYSFQWSS